MQIVKNIFKSRIVRIVSGVAYVLIAAEIFLRIFNPVAMLPRYVEPKYYGIRGNIGSMKYWHTTQDVKVQMRINSRGIRADYEIPYKKPMGVKRIVVLGDSFGMGYEVNLEDTFTARMSDMLNNSGIKCEVVNLSTSGFSNAEELIVLQNEGFKYEPDLVLLAWHAGDLNENKRSNLFKLENGQLKRNAATYLPGAEIQQFMSRYPLIRFVTDNSHLFNELRDKAGRKGKAFIDVIRKIQYKQAASTGNENEVKNENLTVAILREIERECKNANSNFMIFDIPNRRSRTEFFSKFPRDNRGGTSGFHYVSPITLFNQHKGELLYWEHGHSHFTPRGCSLSGEALAQYIMANKLL